MAMIRLKLRENGGGAYREAEVEFTLDALVGVDFELARALLYDLLGKPKPPPLRKDAAGNKVES